MKMFAGEWTIKVLGWLGMEEGMAIEDKRISKGILRAQKKVEERNFLARKNLLEYDEVMDHQRTTFYGMRQKVLRGQNVDGIIWDMIGEAIADAVDKYITQDYVAATVAEWARVNFDVTIDPDDLHGKRKIDELEAYIKYQARAEADTNITATLGEFMGEDEGDAAQWDTKGLQSWAMSRFQVNLSQNQLRQMSDDEIEASSAQGRHRADRSPKLRRPDEISRSQLRRAGTGQLGAQKFGIDDQAGGIHPRPARAQSSSRGADRRTDRIPRPRGLRPARNRISRRARADLRLWRPRGIHRPSLFGRIHPQMGQAQIRRRHAAGARFAPARFRSCTTSWSRISGGF